VNVYTLYVVTKTIRVLLSSKMDQDSFFRVEWIRSAGNYRWLDRPVISIPGLSMARAHGPLA